MEYVYKPAKVEDMLKEITDTYALTARNKNLRLDLKLPEAPLPEAELDAEKIRQVFNNLIDNALKYTERGGVTVKAELSTSDYDKSGVLRITVSDTGLGIPAENIPYVFVKFSRGKDTLRLHATGTGLGLYVGKQLVEAHHGRIWVESDGPGKGSRFVVDLPLRQK